MGRFTSQYWSLTSILELSVLVPAFPQHNALKNEFMFCFNKRTCFVCVGSVCVWVHVKARRGNHIPWNSGYRQLWAAHVCILATEPGSMARAASVRNSLSTMPPLQASQQCSSLNKIYLLCMFLYLFSLSFSLFSLSFSLFRPLPSCSEYMWLKLEVIGSLWVLYPAQKPGSSLSLWHDIEGHRLFTIFQHAILTE